MRPTPEVIAAAYRAQQLWLMQQKMWEIWQLQNDLAYMADCARSAQFTLGRAIRIADLAMRYR